MVATSKQLVPNSWVSATWDEYLTNIENPAHTKTKGYYHNGKYRIEMTPIGNEHSQDHSIINHAVYLYATFKNIPLTGKDNCSYRQVNLKEFQPDLSYYVGNKANAIPWGVGVVNLDEYPVPDLIIEISNTSLADDLGEKRLLYEDLEIAEYWVVDVQNVKVIAFAIKDGGSKRIAESQVLTGLKIETLTAALQRSRNSNHTEVGSWLMQQFQGQSN
ncbi:MAG: Uma2 family endonuclease [Pleurocapsa sp. SU_5_0]|nr:Uma2 family endonuclease [Pleurocapsa sp. SU_5_0]NJO95179.1 Uma2 family endonuclease [Pleurocapsa sp. CRU_1_2]NJR46948.1 Uma2 family endonuclease [Hyellaceae cyanobacterium CSU_1_1]